MTITNPLIKRLAIVFSDPESPDPEAFLEEYQRLVSKFPAAALSRAGDTLIRAGGRNWPTPKQIVDACSDAEEALMATNSAKMGQKRPEWPWEVHAEQAREWAERWMQVHPLADQARREGWAREIKSYVTSFARENLRVNRAPPDPSSYRPPYDQVAYYRSLCGINSKEAHRA